MNVFALVSTDEHAGVVHGVVTHTGAMAEYEGHPRVDLKLAGGMPVFDERARLIGYSRVVAWDVDRFMLVPYEKIVSARTSTPRRRRGGGEKTSAPVVGEMSVSSSRSRFGTPGSRASDGCRFLYTARAFERRARSSLHSSSAWAL